LPWTSAAPDASGKPREQMTPTIRQRTRFHGAGVAVPGDNAAVRTGQLPPGTRVIPLPREDAAPLAELSAHDRGAVVVAGLRDELDLLGAAVVRAQDNDDPRRANKVLAVQVWACCVPRSRGRS